MVLVHLEGVHLILLEVSSRNIRDEHQIQLLIGTILRFRQTKESPHDSHQGKDKPEKSRLSYP